MNSWQLRWVILGVGTAVVLFAAPVIAAAQSRIGNPAGPPVPSTASGPNSPFGTEWAKPRSGPQIRSDQGYRRPQKPSRPPNALCPPGSSQC